MCDSIEEIQESKKRRQKGIDAWAEMLERIQARGPAQPALQNADSCGGASLPHDSVYMSDPKTQDERKNRLEAVKASHLAAQSEARRTQDVLHTQPPQTRANVTTPDKPQPPKAPSKAAAPPIKATLPAAHHKATPATLAEAQVPQAPAEEADKTAQGPQFLQENSKEAAEQRVQLSTLAGVPQPKAERIDLSAEEAISAAQEAAQLAALRSGVGADPSKAAKEYVLACDIPGVKDTFQGGIYEEFRVAL